MLYKAVRLNAAIFACMVVAAAQAPSFAADVEFGSKASYASSDAFDLAVSDDKKAFTITFSDLEASIGNAKLPAKLAATAKKAKGDAPIVSKVFSLTLPIKSEKSAYVPLYLQGYALVTPGSRATLVFSANGQNTVVPFKADLDDSFLQDVKIETQGASELRLTVFLLVERDSAGPDAGVYLNVATIDTDLEKAKERSKQTK